MNIVILTEIYPLPPSRIKNNGRTKAGHYYALAWKDAGHKVIVLNIEADFFLRGGCAIQSERYEVDGVPACYICCPRFIPHSQRVFGSTAKRVARIAKQYIAESGMDSVDLFYCDFATGNMEVISLLKRETAFRNSRFVPVFHNCDFFDLKRAKALIEDAVVVGARAESQKKRILALDPSANVFFAFSGAPKVGDKSVVQKVEQKVNLGARPRRILFVGSLIPLKNVDILLQSFEKVHRIYPDTELTIVGDGPERTRLFALAERLHLRDCAKFTGAVSRQSVLDLMVESDLFVMVSSPETFGIVYVEALGAGCYVIAALGEGIDGVIRDGVNGSLVEPRNVDALADKMLWYLGRSEEERRQLLFRSYQTAQLYTEEQVAKNVLTNIDDAFRKPN